MASASGSSEHRARRTLRGRVSLLGVVVIAAWIVLVTAAFNLVLADRLDHQADDVLRTRAVTAAATVDASRTGKVVVRENDGDGQLDSGIWVYATGRVVTRPPGGDERLDRYTASLVTDGASLIDRGSDRFFVQPVRRDGRVVATVVASLSLLPYHRARDEAFVGSLVVALLAILGAYPVLRVASGRALRPVTEMTRRAREWSARGLDERFGTHQAHSEVQELALTLNSVLDTLAAIVRHERQLSAELSHELRTPLSRIVAEADLLTGRPSDADTLAQALTVVRDSALDMERILTTLLSAARQDVRIAPGRCELAAVLRPSTGLIRRAGAATGPSISVVAEPGIAVGVEAAVCERILAPILDNALRYARSEVRIVAVREPDDVVLDVVDDGPGVPGELRELIFEPGRRGEPGDDHEGAGLGLALARRLARAAGGDVEVFGEDARFRIRLPPA